MKLYFLLNGHSIPRVGNGVGKLSTRRSRRRGQRRVAEPSELTSCPVAHYDVLKERVLLSVQTSTTKEVLGSTPPAQRRRIRLRSSRRWRFLGGVALLAGGLVLLVAGLLQLLGFLRSFRLAPAMTWGYATVGLAVIVGTAAFVVLKEVLRQRALVARGLLAVARIRGETVEEKGRGGYCVVNYEFTDTQGRRVEGRAQVSRSLYSGERVLALFVDPGNPRNHILAVAAMYELVV